MQHARNARSSRSPAATARPASRRCCCRSCTRRARVANPGNRNNEIGLPLAVLDAPEDAQFAIYEMGAGKPGDIAYLTAIARPDVALVNNVAPAHLERMGSLLGIADTKAAIYDALPADGVAVINADDAFAPYFAERAHGRRLIRFGLEPAPTSPRATSRCDADGTRFMLVTPQGEAPYRDGAARTPQRAQRARRRGAGAGVRRRAHAIAPWPALCAQSPAGCHPSAAERRAADRRQLQRQSRFLQRRDRHACRMARRKLAGARRHARTRRRRRALHAEAGRRAKRPASRGCMRSAR